MPFRDAQRAPTARKPHVERVADIIAAARAEFAASGYDGASMAEIAARAGITEGAIYKHVGGKRELLYAVTREVFEPLVERMAREVEPIEGVENRLRYLAWRQLEQLTSDRGLSRVVIRAVRPHDEAYQQVVVGMQRRVSQLVLQIIAEGVEAGELRADVPAKMLRDVVLSSVEQLVWKAVNGDAPFDAERAADELIDIALTGAASRPAPQAAAPPVIDRLERLADRIECVLAGASRSHEETA
jgi:AcrR family transcriptional regulator